MGVEADHHLPRIRRDSLKAGSKNIWTFWSRYTHSNRAQLIGHTGGWGQESRDLSLRLLPTAARKNWAQEQRSETLWASRKKPVYSRVCRKLKNKRRNRCKLQNRWGAHVEAQRQNRDRCMSAIQEDCIHGRTVSILCHQASTWNPSENCNPPSLTILKRTTGFYHCKLLHSWTKIYASKARIPKIWALLNLQLPKKRVSWKHLPTHSLPHHLKYLHFVTETQAAPSCGTWSCQDYISFMTAILMSYCHHCNWKCRIPDVDAYSMVTGRRRLWNESPWYLHEKNNQQTKSWAFKGTASLPFSPVKQHFPFVYYYWKLTLS